MNSAHMSRPYIFYQQQTSYPITAAHILVQKQNELTWQVI